MPPTCPEGWELVSMPSTPDGKSNSSGPDPVALSSVKQMRWESVAYEWIAAEGVLPVQGNCGSQVTFSGTFYIERSSVHTINLGVNVNARKEVVEITGGYSYSFGTTLGAGSSLSETVGAPGYEYLVTPVVLRCRYCWGYIRDGIPWYDIAIALMKGPAAGIFTPVATFCSDWIYMRGGIMICRRRCEER